MVFHYSAAQTGDLLGKTLFEGEKVGGDVGGQRHDLGVYVGDLIFEPLFEPRDIGLGRHFGAHFAKQMQNQVVRFGHWTGLSLPGDDRPHKPIAFLSASSIRACQPGPPALNRSTTSGLDLMEIAFQLVKTTSFGSPSLRGALATKQSRGRSLWPLDCFAPLAMTAEVILSQLESSARVSLSREVQVLLDFAHALFDLGEQHAMADG